MKLLSILLLIIFCYCFVNIVYGIKQVHISLGTDETEMIVTWIKPNKHYYHSRFNASVYYGKSKTSLNQTVKAKSKYFKDGKTRYTTFRALMTKLKPGTKYYYRIKLDSKKSSLFKFKTMKNDENFLPRFAIYGDLGYRNAKSMPYLKKDVHKNLIDVIFHIGDFAYDLNSKNGRIGHKFMKLIEPIASKVPYMTCPGNHERHDNFSHYDSRFSMIGDRSQPIHSDPINKRLNNHFHSMTIGPATIILFSTEYYYYTKYGWQQIEHQYRWLEQELKLANENRQKHPWIIVMGHRPFYCVKVVDRSCDNQTMERKEIRQGIRMYDKGERHYGLEDLFFKYGVDIQFYGHEHLYARFFPIYKRKMYNGTKSNNPYDHPGAPIHITTGSAGSVKSHPVSHQSDDWVTKYLEDYGYTRLMFEDKYHIRLQQISINQHGKVMDEIEILKSTPEPHWMNVVHQ
uniref:Purple acid phosphatase n=1 Tax=Dermatophagoides pteronyssinus TaxID=6956 RepID=A0A6P6Y7Z3_DERPT|nr:acid phosphatase type 7-like isoform X1 [Dermatophagoides pteronyssinus]